jgi:hypothetical protein
MDGASILNHIVLAKVNDNAYKIDLPGNYGVRTTFNVVDLSPFFGDEVLELRTTPFQGGGGRMMRTTHSNK